MAIIPVFIPHAGCPHQCVFCNQKTISGQQKASAEAVQGQIDRYVQWIKPGRQNEAAFYGGSFTGLSLELQKELFKPVDKLLADGIVGSVRLSTRPDYIDVERLKLLLQHGVKTIELGVQSLDDTVLAASERGHHSKDVFTAVQLLREYGFSVGLQLMIGMPQQSFASVQNTVLKVLQLKPDLVRIYPLLVIQGTPLATSFKNGDFIPLSLDEAVRQSAYIYQEMTQAKINVIRIGLQADEELCREGNILAGPFHPAFGELVQSYLLYEDLTPQLRKLIEQGADALVISCPVRLESQIRGLKNNNLHRWQSLFAPVQIKIHSGVNLETIEIANEVQQNE